MLSSAPSRSNHGRISLCGRARPRSFDILHAADRKGRATSSPICGDTAAIKNPRDLPDTRPHEDEPRGDLTQLIEDARSGHDQARERLLSEVYRELWTIAAASMRHERVGRTLGATALINESYLKLFGGAIPTGMSFAHRHAFFKAASVAMRRILIDHARARATSKRLPSPGRHVISADLEIASRGADPHELMALDEALKTLEAKDKRAAEVVQLRFYAGRSLGDIAAMTGVSERTIKRDWEFARARLQQLLDTPTRTDGE